jgi:hypothetical protein
MYWLKVLKHFEANNYVQNGLTIPFLVGSRRLIESKENILSVNEFIDSMTDYGCTLLYCDTLKEFIIGSIDIETEKYNFNGKMKFKNIYQTDESLKNIKCLNDLKSFFSNRYQSIINSNKFSKSLGKWNDFSDEEIKQIMEILK